MTSTSFFLRASTASSPKPSIRQSTIAISKWIASTLGGGQDSAGAIYPLDMLTTSGTDENQSIRETSAELGAAYYGWYKAWISPSLIAQTISGTLTANFDWNEGNLAHNTFPRIMVYVWKGDNTGVRGVLYNETNSAIEADTSDASLQQFFGAVALSSVDILDGDRIVIEIMGYDNNTKTASYLHAINFDGAYPCGSTCRDSIIWFSQNLISKPSTQGIII